MARRLATFGSPRRPYATGRGHALIGRKAVTFWSWHPGHRHRGQDASAGNTALINALRNGGDLLNVFGDFPTLANPRHADAYSPLWDASWAC